MTIEHGRFSLMHLIDVQTGHLFPVPSASSTDRVRRIDWSVLFVYFSFRRSSISKNVRREQNAHVFSHLSLMSKNTNNRQVTLIETKSIVQLVRTVLFRCSRELRSIRIDADLDVYQDRSIYLRSEVLFLSLCTWSAMASNVTRLDRMTCSAEKKRRLVCARLIDSLN